MASLNVEAAKAALKNAVEAKMQVKIATLPDPEGEQQNENHDAYTETIGENLGIKGVGQNINREAAKLNFPAKPFQVMYV